MRPRTLLTLLVFSILGVLVWRHLGDLSELGRTLRQGEPGWIAVAFVFQVLGLLNNAALYWALYRVVDLNATYAQILPLSLGSQFVNFATPSSGLGGTAVFVADAKVRGLATGKVVFASVLFSLFNLLWFSLILILGLTLLFLRHDLAVYEVVSGVLLLTTTLLMLAALVLAGVRPAWLERTGQRLASFANRLCRPLLKRDVTPPGAVETWVAEFGGAAWALRGRTRALLPSLLFTVLTDLLEMGVLYTCLRAFLGASEPLSLGVLIAAYSIGVLFTSVSVTPQGLGVVEGAMGATLVSLGLPVAEVALGVLSYRGLSYWLPLLVGGVAMRVALQPNVKTEVNKVERRLERDA